jgi:hypothetical protein
MLARVRLPILIFVVSFLFYLATLAPTVQWGDFGGFQTRSSVGELELHPFGHPLWNLIARPFVWFVPFGDDAFRVNLSSAFFASLALVMLYLGALRITASHFASLFTVLALAISHTFWTYAVVPKAYSLTLFILATCILLLHQWRNRPGSADRWRIAAVGALTGLGVMNHLIVLTAMPGLLLFIAWHSRRRVRDALAYVLGFALGLAPYLILLSTAPDKGIVTGAFIPSFIAQFIGVLLSPRELLQGIAFTIVNLGYQFIFMTFVGVWGWWLLWQRDRSLALLLLLIFLGDMAFVMVPTEPPYMMLWHLYHPAYLAFAYALAVGIQALQQRIGRGIGQRVAWTAAIVVPVVLIYFLIAPDIARAFDLTERLGVRDFPGRDTVTFLFTPSKAGDFSARVYGESVFATLPPHAVIIADWTPYAALWYLQAVEGRRPDVTLAELTDEPLVQEVNRYRDRPVYLADVSRYYDLESVQTQYRIQQEGPVYRLLPSVLQ